MKKMGTLSPGLGVWETTLKMLAPTMGLTSSGRVHEDRLALGCAEGLAETDAAPGPEAGAEATAAGCVVGDLTATGALIPGEAGAAAPPHAAKASPRTSDTNPMSSRLMPVSGTDASR